MTTFFKVIFKNIRLQLHLCKQWNTHLKVTRCMYIDHEYVYAGMYVCHEYKYVGARI